MGLISKYGGGGNIKGKEKKIFSRKTRFPVIKWKQNSFGYFSDGRCGDSDGPGLWC
jgi:hypothetical protein